MNGGKGTSMQCYPVVWDVSGNVLIIAEPRRADGSEDVTAGGEAKGGGEGRWRRLSYMNSSACQKQHPGPSD